MEVELKKNGVFIVIGKFEMDCVEFGSNLGFYRQRSSLEHVQKALVSE